MGLKLDVNHAATPMSFLTTNAIASRNRFSSVLTRCLSSTSAARPRDGRFSVVTDVDLAHFRDTLGDNGVITDGNALASFNVDWMKRYHGNSTLALRPRSTAQVAAVMEYCNSRCLAVVPQGGNTGLVGGCVAVHDEVILCLSDMDEITSFDATSGVAVVQAGVVLDNLDKHIEPHGYRVPLDLGAKNRCQIGGNVATNAGGTRFLRLGTLRASVLGIEAVLPDGRVLDALTTVRKDNTGYDLKQLFIGSEGTLGIITKVAIACAPRSAALHTVVLQVRQFSNVVQLLYAARTELGEVLSAFEYMDTSSVTLAVKHMEDVGYPLQPDGCCGYVLIETAGSNGAHDRAKLDRFVTHAAENGFVFNSVIAEDDKQAASFWKLRESLPGALVRAGRGGTLKYDISVPVDKFEDALHTAKAKLEHLEHCHVVGWGHIGDGNLHLNAAVSIESDFRHAQAALEPWVYEYTQMHGGSVSAEHGLGQMKVDVLHYSKSKVSVDVMHIIKSSIDENGICNPYKVLPWLHHRL